MSSKVPKVPGMLERVQFHVGSDKLGRASPTRLEKTSQFAGSRAVILEASDIAALEPVIVAAVRATLAEIAADEARLDGQRLGYTEAEAAGLLGVRPHVLRDARLRGEISGRLVGKKIVYARSEILRFLGTTR